MRKLLILIVLFISIGLSAQTYELNDTINIPGVTVNGSYSATRTTPFTFQNLSKTDIALSAQNNEPAVLLSRITPSISTYSESGTGMGYIFFRMRGIDQTRINSTFNGVPLNEPEDQGIYYNNYAGLLNSLSSVQVIRGAGISKPGVSSYGGSINFNPQEFGDKLHGYIGSVYGSNSTGQAKVGVSGKSFFVNALVSSTNGYKDHTYNRTLSTFYGFKKTYKQSEFRLYGFVGHQANGMGWVGETLDSIYKNPRCNSNSPDEKDDFFQIHNQGIWKYKNLSTTIYYTYLKGKYGVMAFAPKIDTLNVQSNWFGANINYLIPITENVNINIGLNSYSYTRKHFGTNDFTSMMPYSNSGHKGGISPYIKAEFKYGKTSIYGDAQYRYAKFVYTPYTDNIYFPDQKYNFLDWSGGVTYTIDNEYRIYYGLGKSHKEPKRTDYFGGLENYAGDYNPLVPEELLSHELGVKYLSKKLSANVNYYFMKFRNEMSLTGNIGANSISLSNINIDKSFRTGIEVDATYTFTKLILGTTTSFSYNKVMMNDGFVGKPVLTPFAIVSLDADYHFTKAFYLGINWKYNSESYIDFENAFILPSYTVLNAYAGVIWNNLEIRGNLNNITNQLILGGAYMYNDYANPLYPRYYVMAGRNGMISLTLKF